MALQGSGKTTSSAKLAIKLKKENRNPLLVACDVYRPAAITQLKTLGKECEVEVFSIENSTDVQEIVKSAIDYANTNNFDTLILDTAGRLQIDTEMMAELLLIDRMFKPDEKLLVIDAMVGQESVNVAENFDAQLGLTGLVLTKLDGDSRGGAALSVVHCTGKPIKLTGTAKNLTPLKTFILTVWRQEFSEWATSFHSLKKLRKFLTKSKLWNLKKSFQNPNFLSMTF